MSSTSIQEKLDLVLTQYRESPNLLAIISTYLDQVRLAQLALCEIPDKFDLDTAVGDQLTILGKWLGFPRCHKIPTPVPVFGFECDGVISRYNLSGFCESAIWFGCDGLADLEVCINDDELYRKFLYVRRYQLQGKNDYLSFQACIEILFGVQATYTQSGRIITVSPGRVLLSGEVTFLKVYERVLPRSMNSSITIDNT